MNEIKIEKDMTKQIMLKYDKFIVERFERFRRTFSFITLD